tara:strand:+ start:7101 stop:7817 length:717 start_codon:yes stop_codon:yes gene_type:complete
MLNVVCSWWGDLYDISYVNKLHSQVKRNCSLDFKFYVQTDNNTTGLNTEIEVVNFGKFKPDGKKYTKMWDRPKCNYWSPNFLPGLKIALDLDILILDDLAKIIDLYQGKPLCLRSWWHDHEDRYFFKQNYDAKINGGCFVWENNIPLWNDLNKNWEIISFCFKTMDNYITWRKLKEFELIGPEFSYSFNRGREHPNNMEIRTKQDAVFCLFNTDNDHDHIELHEAYHEYDWIKEVWTI